MNISILAAENPSSIPTLVMFGLMFVVVYFFMIRPQQKKRKKLEEERAAVKKGDKVITIGGIHGKVTAVDDTTVTIAVEEGKLKIEKSAITIDGSETIAEQPNNG